MDYAKVEQAINSGDIDVVTTSIAEGMDVNHRYDDGVTPLMLAMRLSNNNMIKLLIAHGADVKAKSDDGRTALFYPCNEVLEYPDSVIEAWTLLLQKGADVNHSIGATTRNTLLMDVVYRPIAGKSQLIKFLIAQGADLYHIRDENGLCGFDWLRREGMDYVVEK